MTTRLTEAFLQKGDTLKLVAPYARAAGDGMKVGSLFGVAADAIASGAQGPAMMEGVFSLAKTTSQAWTQGDKIYWDDSTKKCTTVGASGMLIGAASADAGSSDAVGAVYLPGAVPSMLEGIEAAVADLVDNSGGATADGTIGAVTVAAALTGSNSGSANGSLVAEGTLSTAGGNTYSDAAVNLILGKVEDNIAELAASRASDRTALIALQDAIKELSAKQNALLAALRLNGIITP